MLKACAINNPTAAGMILLYYCRCNADTYAPPSFPDIPDYTLSSTVASASEHARRARGEPALTTTDAIVAYVHPLYNTLAAGLGKASVTMAQFRDIYDQLIGYYNNVM